MVQNNQRCHRFHNRYCPGHHTGIMSSFPTYRNGLAGFIDGGLVLHDGSNGLEGATKIDIHPVTDTSLDAARTVRGCDDLTIKLFEQIIVFRPLQRDAGKSRSVLESL